MKRRKIFALIAITIYISILTAILSIYVDTNERAKEELSKLGPNIIVRPKLFLSESFENTGNDESTPQSDYEGYINIEEVIKIKKHISWRNNIVALTPSLYFPAVERRRQTAVMTQGVWFEKKIPIDDNYVFKTGLLETFPSWQIKGKLPETYDKECLVSSELAELLQISCGSNIELKIDDKLYKFVVAGIVSSGFRLREQVFLELEYLQKITNREELVSRIFVRAMTNPEEEAPKNPQSLPPKEFEKWLCSPYPSTIASKIEEALQNVQATPITKITTTEARYLKKCEGIFITLITGGLVCIIIGIISYVNFIVFSRRYEISIMKAIGATNSYIASIFIYENLIISLLGGILGFVIGSICAGIVSNISFNHGIHIYPANGILSILSSIIITLTSTSLVIHKINQINVASLLKRE